MYEVWARVAGRDCRGWFAERPADLAAFQRWIADRADAGEVVAVDSETTGLDTFVPGFRLRLVQFGTADEGWLIPVEHGPEFARAARDALMTLPRMTAQNFPFDGVVFDQHLGVPLELTFPRVIDTKILAHLLDSRGEHEGGRGLSLKPLAAHYVDPHAEDAQRALVKVFRSIGATKETGWAVIDVEHPEYLRYALLDVLYCARLLPKLQAACRSAGVPRRLATYEHRVASIGAVVERAGMLVDAPYTHGLVGELEAEAQRYAAVASRYGVASVNAPAQVSAALVGMGEELTETTETGQLSAGKEVLLPLADLDKDWHRIGAREPNPLADAVLRSKRAGKWSKSYAQAMLESLDEAGRVHPRISTLGARTARWSVSSPPLQQLPSSDWRIRRCLTADPGHVIVACDFAQVELRVLAALAGAADIVAAINGGQDLHSFTTRLVFGIGPEVSDAELKNDKRRKLCKVISLGKAYAGGAKTLARQTGLPLAQVQAAVQAYDRALPAIARFAKRLTREAQHNGMTVQTPSGRVLRLDRDKSYTAIAYLCQSSARDVLGQALCDMDDAGLLPYLVGVVHDEVLASAPAGEAADVARALGAAMSMPFHGVNIEADPQVYGPTWGHGYGAAA